jgi:hypothetical protein
MRALTLTALVVLMTAPGVATAQTVLDRIVARVNATIVTQSDVRQAADLKLVPADAHADRVVVDRAITEALVNRILILAEIARYPPPDPSAEAIAAARQQWVAQFDAKTDLSGLLGRAGMTDAALQAWLRDDLRVQAYEDRRFAATAIVTRDDLLKYYRDHADEFRTPTGALTPFEQGQADLKVKLAARTRETAVRDWIAGLRARADIR